MFMGSGVDWKFLFDDDNLKIRIYCLLIYDINIINLYEVIIKLIYIKNWFLLLWKKVYI